MTSLYDEAEDSGLDWRAVGSDLDRLREKGWIVFDKSSGPVRDVVITQPGMDAAEEFSAFRNNPRNRAPAARNAILQWLYDERLHGKSSPNIEGFPESTYGTFYGAEFTDTEIALATKHLREQQLIRGKAALGGPVVRPEITAWGVQAIEEQDKPAAVLASESASVTNIYNFNHASNVNFANNSPGAQQSIALTTTQINDARLATSAFSQTFPILGIPEEHHAQAKQVIADLEEETAAAEPQPGKLKTLLNKVMEIAVLGTAEGAVGAVVALAQKAIDGMP